MKASIEVYQPNQLVTLHRPGVEAIVGRVVAVCIEANDHITYKIVWWADSARVTEWLSGDEFSATSDQGIAQRVAIGYIKPEAIGSENRP